MVAPPGPSAAPSGARGLAEEDESSPWEQEHERREGIVGESMHGERLDRMLVALVPEFSRNYLQTLIEGGHVTVDGAVRQQSSRKLSAAQVVAVELVPTPESRAFRAEAMPLSVVFEDEHLMVIDKPAGLVVHPAAGHWTGTLLNGLLAHHAQAASLPRAGIVHRLDKDTSGLMVVARSLQASTALVRQIAAREVHREYLAVAHGRVPDEPFVVDAPIGRDPKSRVRMAVVASGKAARTDVRRLATCQVSEEGHSASVSLVACTLHTGRTHQIRVHMAHRSHPLVGDVIYGGRALLGLSRQALHAHRLALTHPVTGQPLAFESPPPADFQQASSAITTAAGDGGKASIQ